MSRHPVGWRNHTGLRRCLGNHRLMCSRSCGWWNSLALITLADRTVIATLSLSGAGRLRLPVLHMAVAFALLSTLATLATGGLAVRFDPDIFCQRLNIALSLVTTTCVCWRCSFLGLPLFLLATDKLFLLPCLFLDPHWNIGDHPGCQVTFRSGLTLKPSQFALGAIQFYLICRCSQFRAGVDDLRRPGQARCNCLRREARMPRLLHGLQSTFFARQCSLLRRRFLLQHPIRVPTL
mmetsp:Transcript_26012/g.62809  ORF Transcript_26012/g.62809 Transcript_26012/m.62809 type:complete len:236 (+) Transcript_26012:534-1241(+)